MCCGKIRVGQVNAATHRNDLITRVKYVTIRKRCYCVEVGLELGKEVESSDICQSGICAGCHSYACQAHADAIENPSGNGVGQSNRERRGAVGLAEWVCNHHIVTAGVVLVQI